MAGKRELKRPRKARRTGVLKGALAAVLLVSVTVLVLRARQNRLSDQADAQAAALVNLPQFSALPLPSPTPADTAPAPAETEAPSPAPTPPPIQEDPYAQALRDMDFQALQALNPDVVGWLLIPDTPVSYPLLQGETNDTYLRHTWRGEYSTRGSIFLDSQCSRDLTDFHTIVYGHRMRNGTMFAPLANYGSESYRQAHPCVYIVTGSGTYRYEIFAVYETDVASSAYQLGMSAEKTRQSFLDDCLGRSVLNTGLVPTPADQILTLSTCTTANDDTRLVVQAVLWGERQEPEASPAPEEPSPAPEGEPSLAPAEDVPVPAQPDGEPSPGE